MRHQVVEWICRDLAPSERGVSEEQAVSVYLAAAAEGTGEPMFRTGRDAMEHAGYGSLAADVDPWIADRFLGLGCPWIAGLPAEGEVVVDLGCGSGVDLLVARRAAGPSGVLAGLDLRPFLLRPAARRSGGELLLLQGTATQIPVRSGAATTVVANGLPPLLREASLAVVLAEAARLLQPGGRFSFVVLTSGGDQPVDRISDLELANAVRYGKPLCAQYRLACMRQGLSLRDIIALPSPFVPGFESGEVQAHCISAVRNHG